MEKLKPCPFCGGEAAFKQTSYGTKGPSSAMLGFIIQCKVCKVLVPKPGSYVALDLTEKGEFNIWHDDRDMVIAAWNRRENDEADSDVQR